MRLAHVWIGEGGISDADPTISSGARPDVEGFCNEVAGELLLPWDPLSEAWRTRSIPIDQWIGIISQRFHVSSVMVARQLWAHDSISREVFFELYETEKSKWVTRASGSTGGNFYLSVPIRNSRRLTTP